MVNLTSTKNKWHCILAQQHRGIAAKLHQIRLSPVSVSLQAKQVGSETTQKKRKKTQEQEQNKITGKKLIKLFGHLG